MERKNKTEFVLCFSGRIYLGFDYLLLRLLLLLGVFGRIHFDRMRRRPGWCCVWLMALDPEEGFWVESGSHGRSPGGRRASGGAMLDCFEG